ncbi:hypothetical protein FKO59_31790 [Burkholderia pseudomallei]|nr:hypothetical protein FKO42_31820 [Burkholderia pseudomallei]QDH42049.1 hypothetical protein FKO59_31790 [Burkholderia pseudomallei]
MCATILGACPGAHNGAWGSPAGAACGAVPGPLAPRTRALTTLGKLDFAQRMAEPVPHNEQTVVRLIR